ncbi:hypothetical protein [Halobaculum gomorrense]|nr:hypothetical protein [Halobaculum gomorrense]
MPCVFDAGVAVDEGVAVDGDGERARAIGDDGQGRVRSAYRASSNCS